MRRLLAIAVVFFATATWACTSPASGSLEDMMAQATWTVEAGSDWNSDRRSGVRIALPALDVTGHRCLTWSVDLVLPPGVSVTGEGASTTRTGLAAGAEATFSVVVERALHNNEVRYERGWFRVKVRNPNDDPGVVLHRVSGSPRWLYPIDFQFGDD